MHHRRRPARALLAIVLVGLAAACGGGGDSVAVEATADFLASSADRTTDSGTGRFELTMTLSDLPVESGLGAEPLRFGGDGAYDVEGERFRMSLDLSDLAQSLASSPLAAPEASASVAALEQPVDMVAEGTTLFLRFPMLTGLLGVETEWVSFDLADLPEGADPFGGSTPFVGGSGDPSAFVDFLRGASDDVEEVGTEEIRGVQTTHLEATLDLEAAIAAAPEEQQRQMEQLLEGMDLSELPVDAVPVDVWVDEEGLVRRVTLTLDLSQLEAPDAPDRGTIAVGVDYFDFGADPEIDVPPDDDVTDVTEQLSGGAP